MVSFVRCGHGGRIWPWDGAARPVSTILGRIRISSNGETLPEGAAQVRLPVGTAAARARTAGRRRVGRGTSVGGAGHSPRTAGGPEREATNTRRQTLLLRFEPQATPPAGDPPSFDVKSGPGTVTLLEGDDAGVPTEASCETHVTMTRRDHVPRGRRSHGGRRRAAAADGRLRDHRAVRRGGHDARRRDLAGGGHVSVERGDRPLRPFESSPHGAAIELPGWSRPCGSARPGCRSRRRCAPSSSTPGDVVRATSTTPRAGRVLATACGCATRTRSRTTRSDPQAQALARFTLESTALARRSADPQRALDAAFDLLERGWAAQASPTEATP